MISDFLMLETGVTGAGAFEIAHEKCAIVHRLHGQDSEAACDRSVVAALEAELAQAAKPEDLAFLLAHYANGCLTSEMPSLAMCADMLDVGDHSKPFNTLNTSSSKIFKSLLRLCPTTNERKARNIGQMAPVR